MRFGIKDDTCCTSSNEPRSLSDAFRALQMQVEHPVTEAITGVNMPATQLQIAMGLPLYNVPDIRRRELSRCTYLYVFLYMRSTIYYAYNHPICTYMCLIVDDTILYIYIYVMIFV